MQEEGAQKKKINKREREKEEKTYATLDRFLLLHQTSATDVQVFIIIRVVVNFLICIKIFIFTVGTTF